MKRIERFLAGEMLSSIYGAKMSELNQINEPSDEQLLDPEYQAFLAKVIADALDNSAAA